MDVRAAIACAVLALAFAIDSAATDFGSRGGPEPANIDEIANVLRQDPYDMELLISYGTSKGGSAGHLALAIRDQAPGDDIVYTANFYADRAPEHAKDFYTDDLMVRVPKTEYLFKTARRSATRLRSASTSARSTSDRSSACASTASPPPRRRRVAAFFTRINDDYHKRASNTEYHDGEIRYDYLRLNCAKTIGSAFRLGAGYKDLDVTSARLLSGPQGRGGASTPTSPPRWR